MKMNFRRNIGIILMMFGVLLTINQGEYHNDFIMNLRKTLEIYWPLILSFIGIYLVSFPRKNKKR